MSERRQAHPRRIDEVREQVQALRDAGRGYREHDEPPGGWPPVLDDDGHVIPDPPPDEPTDAPHPAAEAGDP